MIDKELLEILLKPAIALIADGSIYDNGFMESKMITPEFIDAANEAFAEQVEDEILLAVSEILDKHFEYAARRRDTDLKDAW